MWPGELDSEWVVPNLCDLVSLTVNAQCHTYPASEYGRDYAVPHQLDLVSLLGSVIPVWPGELDSEYIMPHLRDLVSLAMNA